MRRLLLNCDAGAHSVPYSKRVVVSCLNRVSNLHSRRPSHRTKPLFISTINWVPKCSFDVGILTMGKLCRILLLIGAPLGATTLQQLPLPEMAQKSTAIVRAKVTSASGVLRGSDVFTVYKLAPTEVWKAPASGAPREVDVPGGVAGGLRQPVDGAPTLSIGREYVLFLWTSRTGVTQLIGLSQGLFDISRLNDSGKAPAGSQPRADGPSGNVASGNSGGNLMVWRSPASERMLDAGGRPVRDQAVSMKLADLRAQVARALAGGR